MILKPQMIRCSNVSDPQSRPQMIPKEKYDWVGLNLADNSVDFIIITKSQINSEISLLK